MAEAQSIAAATAMLRRVLMDGIPKQDALLSQVDVTSLPPDRVNANVDRATLNVFLYRVARSSAQRNRAPSTSALRGEARSTDDLTLQYLLSAYGRVDQESGDLSHRVLGAAMRVLEDTPLVSESDVQAMTPLHDGLSASPSLRIVPLDTNLEQMAALWSLFHTSYRLSVAYEVTVLTATDEREPGVAPRSGERRSHEKLDAAVQALGLERDASAPLMKFKSHIESKDQANGCIAMFVGGSEEAMRRIAHLIARDANRDLYRIDLATVSDKYIGETEKNLRSLFDEAQSSGAILFFDEADALFGKRGDVRDSHDRYANIEVSYLMQCIEAFQGPVVLTAANKSALDPAFLRRLRYVVDFPPVVTG